MPRLARDCCSSLRYDLGTYERSLAVKYLAEQKRFKITQLSAGSGIIIGAGLLGIAGVASAFFLAPNIMEEIKEKIGIVRDFVADTKKTSSGQNIDVEGVDGGYATVLLVGWKDERQWTVEPSPNEGAVVVAPASGIPIVGALTGSALYVLTFAQDKEEYVGIWGNTNKNAKRIEDLSEPWWYLDPKTGGPLY